MRCGEVAPGHRAGYGYVRRRQMRNFGLLSLALMAVFLAGASLQAQTANTGAISGTVTDSTGAIVPRALVELLESGKGSSRSQSSNDSGQYVFPNVPPGRYKLTASKAG